MANTMRLISGTLTLEIELNDGPTAVAVWDALPIESRASSGDTPVAASPVNHMGTVSGDATVLRAVRDGDPMRLERL